MSKIDKNSLTHRARNCKYHIVFAVMILYILCNKPQLPMEFKMFPTILEIQWGTRTILVWVEFPDDSEIMIREVQMLDWPTHQQGKPLL